MKRTILGLLCTLALLPAAYACLNDRDSDALAEEAQQLPDMVRILTGRFERNPPRYYQMRLARVTKELQKNPGKLALYDDAAVAAERLQNSDEAIAWMAKKKARMGSGDKEATYRYHANIGTFLAHRWLLRKDRWEQLSEMQQAHDHIARAVEIKPDAHFNRERYQLEVMKWILTRPYENQTSLAGHLPDDSDTRQAEGFSGLIVLGAAWESVDVMDTLVSTLRHLRHKKLGEFAALRRDELLKAGKHSLMYRADVSPKGDDYLHSGFSHDITVPEGVKAKFVELRQEADTWQKARLAYMEARFAQGKHPDTDPNFWSEWKPAIPPSLEIPGEEEAKGEEARRSWWNRYGILVALSVLMGLLALLITGIVFLTRWLRRRFAR